jgi:hypothetical protein
LQKIPSVSYWFTFHSTSSASHEFLARSQRRRDCIGRTDVISPLWLGVILVAANPRRVMP